MGEMQHQAMTLNLLQSFPRVQGSFWRRGQPLDSFRLISVSWCPRSTLHLKQRCVAMILLDMRSGNLWYVERALGRGTVTIYEYHLLSLHCSNLNTTFYRQASESSTYFKSAISLSCSSQFRHA